MIKEAWFIVAIMSGVYEDGTKDVFILQEPQEHGHFHSSLECREYVRDNPVPIIKALTNQYGNQPLEKILCVPEENVRKFIEGQKLDAL